MANNSTIPHPTGYNSKIRLGNGSSYRPNEFNHRTNLQHENSLFKDALLTQGCSSSPNNYENLALKSRKTMSIPGEVISIHVTTPPPNPINKPYQNPLQLLRIKAVNQNITISYSPCKVILVALFLAVGTGLGIFASISVSLFLLPAVVLFWLIIYLIWPHKPNLKPNPAQNVVNHTLTHPTAQSRKSTNADRTNHKANKTNKAQIINNKKPINFSNSKPNKENKPPLSIPKGNQKCPLPITNPTTAKNVRHHPHVVDYKIVQEKVGKIEDIALLNFILAQYINQAIKMASIKRLNDIFTKKGINIDSLSPHLNVDHKLKIHEVNSEEKAYQYMYAQIEYEEQNATQRHEILAYGDLSQVNTHFDFNNGKSEHYNLELVVIAREAAANILYLFAKTDILDQIQAKFDTEVNREYYIAALKHLKNGIMSRSLPIRRKSQKTAQVTDLAGKVHNIDVSAENDKKTQMEVINKIDKMLGFNPKQVQSRQDYLR